METIKQLTELDYKALIIGISIVIGAFKIAYTSYSWIISKFGLETKKMRQKREDHELLIATAKNLADDITLLEVMKKLKEKLVVYYNKYKNSDGWDSMDKEVFWDLFDDYEARGGDGFIHSKVEPVMRELKVIDKE